MVDYDKGRIILGGKEEPILRFEVWWMTPFGLATTFLEAREIMKERVEEDVPLQMCLTPLPVAISASLHEILLGNKG